MNTHPEKWYIPLTDDNYDEVKSWWLKQAEKSGWGGRTLPHDVLVLSEHPWDFSHYWSGPTRFSVRFPDYRKITLEQFRKITNSQPMKQPEHWCIEATKENFVELYTWWRKNAAEDYSQFTVGCTLMSEHPKDESKYYGCLLYTSPSPRDLSTSRMPSSA